MERGSDDSGAVSRLQGVGSRLLDVLLSLHRVASRNSAASGSDMDAASDDRHPVSRRRVSASSRLMLGRRNRLLAQRARQVARSGYTLPGLRVVNIHMLAMTDRSELASYRFAERARPEDQERRRPLTALLKSRELGARSMQQTPPIVADVAAARLPTLLRERALPSTRAFNKIFCSDWLSERHVVAGTKCNNLVVWDVDASTFVRHVLPPAPEDPGRVVPSVHSGMHALAINPSRTLLACGGDNPNDVAVLELPTFRPMALLQRHDDWLFGLQWTSDTALASCSRDGMLGLWNMETLPLYQVQRPSTPATQTWSCLSSKPDAFLAHTPTRERIRDIAWAPGLSQLASISRDSFLRLWDVSRAEATSSVPILAREPVCVTSSPLHHIFAVGAMYTLSFVDPRSNRVHQVPVPDCDRHAVRSLSFNEYVASVGTGNGRLSFYDMRAARFLPLGERPGKLGVAAPSVRSSSGAMHTSDRIVRSYATGAGWLDPDAATSTVRRLTDSRITPSSTLHPHVPFTHAYDPSGSRLFVGGGPLQVQVPGCYAAIW